MPTQRPWGVKCTASSKRTGLPCRAWAVRGAFVCIEHGGQLPPVRVAAARRLAEAKLARKGISAPPMSYAAALMGDREDRRNYERRTRRLLLELRLDQAE